MLTVKRVEKDGQEEITTAKRVWRDPTAVGDNNEYPCGVVLALGVPDVEGFMRFAVGTIYVMNERGSTIATYHLG